MPVEGERRNRHSAIIALSYDASLVPLIPHASIAFLCVYDSQSSLPGEARPLSFCSRIGHMPWPARSSFSPTAAHHPGCMDRASVSNGPVQPPCMPDAPKHLAHLLPDEHGLQPFVASPGLEVSRSHLLENLIIERQVGHELLEPSVFLLEIL